MLRDDTDQSGSSSPPERDFSGFWRFLWNTAVSGEFIGRLSGSGEGSSGRRRSGKPFSSAGWSCPKCPILSFPGIVSDRTLGHHMGWELSRGIYVGCTTNFTGFRLNGDKIPQQGRMPVRGGVERLFQVFVPGVFRFSRSISCVLLLCSEAVVLGMGQYPRKSAFLE